MDLGIEVSAAIFNDSKTKIGVSSFEQRGENDAAGGDSIEKQRVDVIGAKDHGKIGAGKGADAMLGNNNFTLFRGDNRWDRPEWFLK